jgi:stearoyl-CoA desaturase (delta-9 desaturase)
MKTYNLVGYSIVLAYLAGCVYFAPPHLGPWLGLVVGAAYFIVFWFVCGVYLADVLHMGIAHRALDYQEWFIGAVTVANNFLGLYVNPTAWVNRHRLHHKYSDHPGDPNKLGSDGFWGTMYRILAPYPCIENAATDAIFKTPVFRLVSNRYFAVFTQFFSLSLLWLLVRDLKFALMMWLGLRVFALWVNMIQNYWTHTREFGYRRYDDDQDNAMNIGEWFPVTSTFSACLQNNHHHYPSLLRLSHDKSEYDFGFLTVKAMKSLGLVKATTRGAVIPKDLPLGALDF